MKQCYPVHVGQILEADVTGYTSEGSGVARVENLAVFIAGAIRGERVKLRIAHIGHTAAYGELLQVIAPSPDRIQPDCPHTKACGGCAFRHMTYEEELRAKRQRVLDALNRIGGFDLADLPITGGEPVGYRNKAQYPVANIGGKPRAGFYRERSHTVVPVKRCAILPEEADLAKAAVLSWMEEQHVSVYDETTRKGLVRHIYVRSAMGTGQVLVCLVINGDGIPNEKSLVDKLLKTVDNFKTLVLSIHKKPGNAVLGDRFVTLYGCGFLEDTLCGLKFRLSPASFYQVNRAQAQKLYEKAVELAGLTGKETVLELYCGAGTITLTMSRKAGKVIGVEIVEDAIRDAKRNAEENHVENVEFYCADASKAAEMFANAGTRPDVIVVDPPRKGMTETVIDAMAAMAPERIVYISCDPATLARDLRLLHERGYELQQAEAFDLFPRCAHVETVVLMSRVKE